MAMLGVIRESCLGFGPPQFFVLSESSVLGFRSVMDIFIIIIILIVPKSSKYHILRKHQIHDTSDSDYFLSVLSESLDCRTWKRAAGNK